MAEYFDSAWYLRTYPDVAQAGVDPWQHYLNHGQFEGRQPGPNRVIAWAHHLWRGLSGMMLPRLEALVAEGTTPPHERHQAFTELLVWYGAEQQWVEVQRLVQGHEALLTQAPRLSVLLLLAFEAELALASGREQVWLAELRERFPNWGCRYLAEANLAAASLQTSSPKVNRTLAEAAWLRAVNALFTQGERPLMPVSIELGSEPLFDRLNADDSSLPGVPGASWRNKAVFSRLAGVALPRVSVVVPAFNSGPRLLTALRSLEAQSWPKLDVIIVNDASTDDTAELAEAFCLAANKRVLPGRQRQWRVEHHKHNQGAYAARNTGVKLAKGAFVTIHDADDWSHPQKIEWQAQALRNNKSIKGTLSHWVRMSEGGHFSRWRIEEGWIYRNVSSLMVRAEVIQQLGYWDQAPVNADTEYYYRILAAYGPDALAEVLPGVPLSFGRHDAASLSQHSETHLRTQFIGLRQRYMAAARRWHERANGITGLYLEAGIQGFPKEEAAGSWLDAVERSGWFDPVWYIAAHPDLQNAAVDAFEHWWRYGVHEGRDPSPGFSVSGYRLRYGALLGEGDAEVNPLWHWLSEGQAQQCSPLPVFSGVAEHAGRPWVLVCGHLAGPQLYGAERSLLDVLQAWQALQVNVQVLLPSALNAAYVTQVQGLAQACVVMPLPWWQQGRAAWQAVQQNIAGILQQRDYQAVYLNTLVHYEAALAAREQGVPVWLHVRELPAADAALCEALGYTPEQGPAALRQHVQALADRVVANSRAVAQFFGEGAQAEPIIVPNVVDADAFAEVPWPGSKRVQVALISSNVPKKGLSDFAEVAAELAKAGVAADCVLIGPQNQHTDALAQADGPNLKIAGYAANPQAALAQAHIVLNLSHFEESFGRTVLEAMAAGRPVVAYAWGALPELVVDGGTGYLVALGDITAVAERVRALVEDARLRLRLGTAAQQRARAHCSQAALVEGLKALSGVSMSSST